MNKGSTRPRFILVISFKLHLHLREKRKSITRGSGKEERNSRGYSRERESSEKFQGCPWLLSKLPFFAMRGIKTHRTLKYSSVGLISSNFYLSPFFFLLPTSTIRRIYPPRVIHREYAYVCRRLYACLTFVQRLQIG